MTRIELSPEVLGDFDRIVDHLVAFGSADAPGHIAEVLEALDILAHSPLIGRKVAGGLRELVIGKGSRGYVVLYRYVGELDAVFILAARGQRESGFKRST